MVIAVACGALAVVQEKHWKVQGLVIKMTTLE